MTLVLREQVRQRAHDCCEYCQIPQSCTQLPHEVDHIRAQKHRGPTTLNNLCWACAMCNAHKGSDASAYVPGTDELVRLFNPRADSWDDHFEWHGPELHGKTNIGMDMSRRHFHELAAKVLVEHSDIYLPRLRGVRVGEIETDETHAERISSIAAHGRRRIFGGREIPET